SVLSLFLTSLQRRLPPRRDAHDQGHEERQKEQEEQELSDPRGSRRDPAEAEDGGDDRHDEEDQRPAEHGSPPMCPRPAWRPFHGDDPGAGAGVMAGAGGYFRESWSMATRQRSMFCRRASRSEGTWS